MGWAWLGRRRSQSCDLAHIWAQSGKFPWSMRGKRQDRSGIMEHSSSRLTKKGNTEAKRLALNRVAGIFAFQTKETLIWIDAQAASLGMPLAIEQSAILFLQGRRPVAPLFRS